MAYASSMTYVCPSISQSVTLVDSDHIVQQKVKKNVALLNRTIDQLPKRLIMVVKVPMLNVVGLILCAYD